MTRFFEIISISAPHIYHSAIPLSPKMSLVQTLYQSYATPFVKVVHGAPVSWDQAAATIKHPEKIVAVAWSPCSRFIALAPVSSSGIQILDAVTLKQLSITSPIPIVADGSENRMGRKSGHLVFSPDGKFLTAWKATILHIINWDIQTGGLMSSIGVDMNFGTCQSITYSECGTMIGTLFAFLDICTIKIFNIVTGTLISSGSFEGKSTQIWTHNGCLCFDTLKKGLIGILETPFTLELEKPLTVVQSLSTPDSFDSPSEFSFHNTLSYLAFSSTSKIEVWDLQNSRPLLNPLQLSVYNPTFSLDGLFFACTQPSNSKILFWKRSLTGYEPHQELSFISGGNLDSMFFTIPHSLVFSPNGEFILAHYGSHVVQLFQTETHIPSDGSTSSQKQIKNFLLDFSPDETLAVMARHHGKMITVLDLEADVPQLIIDADEEVLALKVVKNYVLVVCQRNVFTWDISKREDMVDSRADVSHSTWSTTFRSGFFPDAVSISPDSHWICYASGIPSHLNVDNLVTKEELHQSIDFLPNTTQFTLDGNEVWCYSSTGHVEGRWQIIKEGEPNLAKLVSQEAHENPPMHPWQSACGYEVTDDGWILSPIRKKLFWLPHGWQLGETRRRWSEHYLALLYGELSEPIIINLEPKE